ncbi:hypothetical protein [uncultured Methylobacterium sp.]|jgi:hypothetical protein|uniref:hypothetical protein n=1 Tax=uncultured Methylobacterium sp. TaxID=157278 RepID=UPI0026202982|nr:hypothetical protein [uncultured Methylobacterium sp.]
MSVWSKTTEGLTKAIVMLAGQADRRLRRRLENPRLAYRDHGVAVHAKRHLKVSERTALNALLKEIQDAKDAQEREPLLAKLAKMPVKMVKVRHESPIDRSRYTGDRLRLLRRTDEFGTSRARRANASASFRAAA